MISDSGVDSAASTNPTYTYVARHAPAMVATSLWGVFKPVYAIARNYRSNPIYRGSAILMINTLGLAAAGFGYWVIAARSYDTAVVGRFSATTSAATLLAIVAAIGVPNMLLRHVTSARAPRELALLSFGLTATVGAAITWVVTISIGHVFPSEVELSGVRGTFALLVLVVGGAINAGIEASLVACRRQGQILLKNVAGSVVRLVSVGFLHSFGLAGLYLSFGLGILIPVCWGSISVVAALSGSARGWHSGAAEFRQHLGFSVPAYLAVIAGMLPSAGVPLLVIGVRGSTDAAFFSIAMMFTALLNTPASTSGQVLFAEVGGENRDHVVRLSRHAFRSTFVVLLPAVVLFEIFAPVLLGAFGQQYANFGVTPLRILAFGTIVAAGCYLCDSILIATDSVALYLIVNVLNAFLVLLCVALGLLQGGLAGGAFGWAVGQASSLVLAAPCVVYALRRSRTFA